MAHFVWLEPLATVVAVTQGTMKAQCAVDMNGKMDDYAELAQLAIIVRRKNIRIGGAN